MGSPVKPFSGGRQYLHGPRQEMRRRTLQYAQEKIRSVSSRTTGAPHWGHLHSICQAPGLDSLTTLIAVDGIG